MLTLLRTSTPKKYSLEDFGGAVQSSHHHTDSTVTDGQVVIQLVGPIYANCIRLYQVPKTWYRLYHIPKKTLTSFPRISGPLLGRKYWKDSWTCTSGVEFRGQVVKGPTHSKGMSVDTALHAVGSVFDIRSTFMIVQPEAIIKYLKVGPVRQ